MILGEEILTRGNFGKNHQELAKFQGCQMWSTWQLNLVKAPKILSFLLIGGLEHQTKGSYCI